MFKESRDASSFSMGTPDPQVRQYLELSNHQPLRKTQMFHLDIDRETNEENVDFQMQSEGILLAKSIISLRACSTLVCNDMLRFIIHTLSEVIRTSLQIEHIRSLILSQMEPILGEAEYSCAHALESEYANDSCTYQRNLVLPTFINCTKLSRESMRDAWRPCTGCYMDLMFVQSQVCPNKLHPPSRTGPGVGSVDVDVDGAAVDSADEIKTKYNISHTQPKKIVAMKKTPPNSSDETYAYS